MIVRKCVLFYAMMLAVLFLFSGCGVRVEPEVGEISPAESSQTGEAPEQDGSREYEYEQPALPEWSEATAERRDPWENMEKKAPGGWYIEPKFDFDDMILLDRAPTQQMIDSMGLKDAVPEDYLRLSLFRKNGRTGVITQNGDILFDETHDVTYCLVCGLTDSDHGKSAWEFRHYGPRGESALFYFGHSGLGAQYYDVSAGEVVSRTTGHAMGKDELLGCFGEEPENRSMLIAVNRVEPGNDGDYDRRIGVERLSPLQFVWVSRTGEPVTEERFLDYRAIPDSGFDPEFWGGTDGLWYNILVNSGPIPVKTLDGVWKYIGTDGETLDIGRFGDALPFHEGVAAVKSDGGWGYIDESGEVVVPFGYEDACSVYDSLAWVKQDGLWGVAVIYG